MKLYFCKIQYKYLLANFTHNFKDDNVYINDYLFARLSEDFLMDKKYARDLVFKELSQKYNPFYNDSVEFFVENIDIINA